MKAARFHGQHDIRIDNIPEPELRPGAVKLNVGWCGICGTDLHEYLDGPIFIPSPGHPHPLSHEETPVTMGQEFSGTVEAIGEGVTDLAVGDNVVVEPYFVCDDCAPCKAGNERALRDDRICVSTSTPRPPSTTPATSGIGRRLCNLPALRQVGNHATGVCSTSNVCPATRPSARTPSPR